MVGLDTHFEKIQEDALHLSLDARSRLASRLLESLDEDINISPEWTEELNRRAKNQEQGTSKLTPHSQVMENVRQALAEIRSDRQP